MHYQLDGLVRRPVSPQFISLCAIPIELVNHTGSLSGISTRYLLFLRFDIL